MVAPGLFPHLQRSIVADEAFRSRWKAAFEKDEPACEALGACQLLSHGIWAFKTSAAGERTDLVLGNVTDVTEARQSSEGLILTEWKRVRNTGELQQKAEDAYDQARRYREGILAGFEVSSPRYLVLVSEDHLKVPGARHEHEATYEYRNIAVDPKSPSKRPRKTAESLGEHAKPI